jgi:FixJ family two-component response regulator
MRADVSAWEMIPLLFEREVNYPILLITGYGEEKDPQDGKTIKDVQNGLQLFRPKLNVTLMRKPFDNEHLRSVLQAALFRRA